MLSGPPLPLPPDIFLQQLLTYARLPGTLGAWVRGSVQLIHLYEAGNGAVGRLLIDADLGRLLGRCDRVVLRQGTCIVVLEAATIIQWRALQVVTSMPHLPDLDKLSEMLPGIQLNNGAFQVPITNHSPEHVLSECLSHGMRVTESRVIYQP